MRTLYRPFPADVKVAIVNRAARKGRIHCEGCGEVMLFRRQWEIDHIIAEAVRPDADKKRRLTPADGMLLCKAKCHRGPEGKTREDVGLIAKAKRREAAHLGVRKKIRRPKEKPPLTKVARGAPEIVRRFT
jgi:hypothetical protein